MSFRSFFLGDQKRQCGFPYPVNYIADGDNGQEESPAVPRTCNRDSREVIVAVELACGNANRVNIETGKPFDLAGDVTLPPLRAAN